MDPLAVFGRCSEVCLRFMACFRHAGRLIGPKGPNPGYLGVLGGCNAEVGQFELTTTA